MGKQRDRHNTAFWIDAWIRSQYHNVVVRYIVHDARRASRPPAT
jgi:hypothetical protein